ncbi:hypothetical protein G3N95_25545 [Paraburkholderia sp. Tr-20389]|uniref:hypothetical protein n=1 Tax=Paraburkholderia sp. Tr-20389 TaxID=2703903 RepID=UPI00197E29ED|nr:hypothetical protein [Paraburkholderia sp. Tr-20389]MBN3756330.1 hypothetical protein [Paraburkholderia sp. Tr-20389]
MGEFTVHGSVGKESGREYYFGILFTCNAPPQMKTGAAPLLRERRLRLQTMPRIAAFKSKP